jgi:hypothetical protein
MRQYYPLKRGLSHYLIHSKYNALYIIRNHLHIDLKLEYVMEEEPNVLWAVLQTHYEQQKFMILPEANHDWTMLRL